MNCPNCHSVQLSVIDSRDCENAIRRRRLCLSCQNRFTTYERIESPIMIIIKKDGRRERFCREKLIKGIMIACKNRPVDQAKIENLVDGIEKDIHILNDIEISSHYIGEKVLKGLKEIDLVGYLRFASVHKRFSDLQTFEKEIQKINK